MPSQIVNVSRLEEADSPVMLVYFVEDQAGERLSAVKASDLINRVDIQKAAIILGYRIRGPVAQREYYYLVTWSIKHFGGGKTFREYR